MIAMNRHGSRAIFVVLAWIPTEGKLLTIVRY